MRSARPRTAVAALAGCASLALVGAGSTAWACSAASALTNISPTVGEPGQRVTGSGTNYAAAPVEIRWNGAEGGGSGHSDGPQLRGDDHGVDRATALALLEELQNLRRNITRLQTIVDEIAQLVTSTT